MHDAVGPVERPVDRLGVAGAGMDELDSGRYRGRAVRVNLLFEAVQDHDVVALGDQAIDDVRADEPRASGNQCPHGARLTDARAGAY